jgi:protein gp37
LSEALNKLVPSFSEISWTHLTFNPWSGCTKVSEACSFCYAEAAPAPRRRGAVWGPTAERKLALDSYWRGPIKWNAVAADAGVRLRVFCASMADVFEDRPDLEPWRLRLWDLIGRTPNLDWLLLTKRPAKMASWAQEHGWLDNAWAGVSIENQKNGQSKIWHLLRVPAKIRFLSCEPLLGPLDFSAMTTDPPGSGFALMDGLGRIDGSDPQISWIIVGGESGPLARPMHPAWARAIRDQAKKAGVAFHFKQWGEWEPRSREDGRPFDSMDRFNRHRLVALDGTLNCTQGAAGSGAQPMSRVGKAAAGRLLDGVLYDEFPEVVNGRS